MESFLPSKTSQVSQINEREEEKFPISHSKYRDLISTFPRRDDWKLYGTLYQYQGFWHSQDKIEKIMAAQEQFKAQPTDIIVCSHPKTGTIWLKALTFAIVTRTQFDDSTSPLLTKFPHDCIPFLESDYLVQIQKNRNPECQVVATQMPYSSLPNSIIDSSCKIVYICRDPKDAFVSMWLFLNKMVRGNLNPIPLEMAFELFCEGVFGSGPYWEHVLEYWKASLEWPERVLFLKYEDLKNETSFYVNRLADFMGFPFTLEEKTQGVVQKIVNLCSFENLSNLEVNGSGKYFFKSDQYHVEHNTYFRKGEIGDWKNYLTEDMGAHLDKIMEHKLRGSGLTFMFRQINA